MLRVRLFFFVIQIAIAAASAFAETDPTTITIAQQGKSNWRIIVPADSSRPVRFAADELKRYIRQMSGCDLGISSADDETSGPTIYVGLRSALPAAQTQQLPAAAAGFDGFSLVASTVRDNKAPCVIIAGDNECGTIYGAYDFLERLGCRWFYPTQNARDPEVVPKSPTLQLQSVMRSVASPLQYRICNGSAWYFAMNVDAARAQLDWGMKNRYNGVGWQSESTHTLEAQYNHLAASGLIDELDRRGMFLHGPAHSFDQFLRNDDYFTSHPEWFGMRNGKRSPQSFIGAQFCWSNPEARQEFARNVEKFIRAAPRLKMLCIVPFDGGKACECSECARIGASDSLMLVMNDVIEKVEAAVPGVLVETVGGYNPMTDPPQNARIHPRLRIVWAHWGRNHRESYDDDAYGRKGNLETWRMAVRNQLTICQYYTDNFAEPWVLPPFTRALLGDRKYFLETGLQSVYMLMWAPGYWWNHSLNGYLAGRALYDVSIDPIEEIHDYAVHYYGEKAGPLIARYYQEWAQNVEMGYRVKDNASDNDRVVLARQRKELLDPAASAVSGKALLKYRVEHVTGLHTIAEGLSEVHRIRQEIQRFRKAGEFDKAKETLGLARAAVDIALARFYEMADRNCGLIDRNEIPGFITAGVKGWIEKEEEAITGEKRE